VVCDAGETEQGSATIPNCDFCSSEIRGVFLELNPDGEVQRPRMVVLTTASTHCGT